MKELLYLLILTLFFISCEKSDNHTKPNVVIILSDDQGWGDLSINGNTNLHTPNIDNLADNGVIFDRFFVCPVCSPTRAELLTGRYHPRGGVYSTSEGGERLDLDETTIAEVFKEAGYSTAAYGKWHNGMQPPYHPNARGFEDFYGFCSGHWGNYFSPMLEHNGEIVKGNGFIIDDLTEKGIRFIEKNKGRPFFLYLPFNTPHSPMQVPDRWWGKFEGAKLEKLNRDPEKEDLQHTRAALAMCENIDWNVGRLIKKIKTLGIEENTIILYFSDNGPNGWRWNGGMKGKKGSTDEGGVRSPLIIKWDGKIQPGKSIHQIAGVIDLLPTLTDLTGINFNFEKPLDGISLKPFILGGDSKTDGRLLFSHWGKRTSVRSQQFRLDSEGRLFDMENDPGQTTDVSELHPGIAKKLKQAKITWENEVLAELPDEDTRTFPIGHPDFKFTQIPARDGTPHGNIKRSNHFPNCSFFTNWVSTEDKITWEGEVLADGLFEVTIYYTCPEKDVGATFELSFGQDKLTGKITEAYNPPLTGMEHDRAKRIESYVKDFKPLNIGTIHLKKGNGILTLKAVDIPGSRVMDFRLLMLKRI
ncbi:MAG: arylsulfatase [Chlorobi bacterium]|nr:arylsulfatase [Chlorobiota bacterium]